MTERYWGWLRNYGYPPEYWQGKFAELFDSIKREYAHDRGKARWAEKLRDTPSPSTTSIGCFQPAK